MCDAQQEHEQADTRRPRDEGEHDLFQPFEDDVKTPQQDQAGGDRYRDGERRAE
jgi:hypothetical protein